MIYFNKYMTEEEFEGEYLGVEFEDSPIVKHNKMFERPIFLVDDKRFLVAASYAPLIPGDKEEFYYTFGKLTVADCSFDESDPKGYRVLQFLNFGHNEQDYIGDGRYDDNSYDICWDYNFGLIYEGSSKKPQVSDWHNKSMVHYFNLYRALHEDNDTYPGYKDPVVSEIYDYISKSDLKFDEYVDSDPSDFELRIKEDVGDNFEQSFCLYINKPSFIRSLPTTKGSQWMMQANCIMGSHYYGYSKYLPMDKTLGTMSYNGDFKIGAALSRLLRYYFPPLSCMKKVAPWLDRSMNAYSSLTIFEPEFDKYFESKKDIIYKEL